MPHPEFLKPTCSLHFFKPRVFYDLLMTLHVSFILSLFFSYFFPYTEDPMKATLALLVVILAVATAQQYLSPQDVAALQAEQFDAMSGTDNYVNQVEYVDALETPANPALVPKYFVEATRPKLKKVGKKLAKNIKKTGKKAVKAGKKAAKAVKKAAKKIAKLAQKAKKGDKKAAKALKKQQKKMKKASKKLGKAARRKLKVQMKKAKLAAKAAKKSAKKNGKAAKEAAKKMAAKKKAQQKKLNKRAKKTDAKVRKAMNKLRHLSTSMDSLKNLMSRINGQVQTLLPENRIRKYKLDDVANISNSKRGSLKNKKESKLVNPFKPDANKGMFLFFFSIIQCVSVV